jgi:hypothetical protein
MIAEFSCVMHERIEEWRDCVSPHSVRLDDEHRPRRSAKRLGQNDGAETVPHVKVTPGPA